MMGSMFLLNGSVFPCDQGTCGAAFAASLKNVQYMYLYKRYAVYHMLSYIAVYNSTLSFLKIWRYIIIFFSNI